MPNYKFATIKNNHKLAIETITVYKHKSFAMISGLKIKYTNGNIWEDFSLKGYADSTIYQEINMKDVQIDKIKM